MRRTWRSLKLGMKSLLLHKLRSGLTVLGIVFGVAAVISMLAVGEGSSRKAQRQFADMGADNIMIRSIKPTEESQSSGGGGRRSVLTYGLTYADYERMLATVPTIKKALPIREIRKQIRYLSRALDGGSSARPATMPTSTAWRSTRDASCPPRTTSGSRTLPCSPPRPPKSCSPTKIRSASRSSSGRITTPSSA